MSPLPAAGSSFEPHAGTPCGLSGQPSMNDKLFGAGDISEAAAPQGGLFVFGAGAREAPTPTQPSPLPGRPDSIFSQAPSPTLPPPLAAEPTVFHFGIQPSATAPVSPLAASASASTAELATAPPIFHFGVDAAATPTVPATAPDRAAEAAPVAFAAVSAPPPTRRRERPRAKHRACGPVAAVATAVGSNAAPLGASVALHHQGDTQGLLASETLQAPTAPQNLGFFAECKLGEAKTRAQQESFLEAVEACLPVLSGPERAVDLLREVCESWHKFDNTRTVEQQDELRSITSQLMAARERSDSLRQLKEQKDRELRVERERRENAEQQAMMLQRKANSWHLYQEAQREVNRLKYELMEVRSAPPSYSRDEVARQMAELECSPLRYCATADRVAQKKKLLLKWHPDKQASPQHAALATQVMQELQNCPEWEF